MNEMYSELLDNLRKQHFDNKLQIDGKKVDISKKYRYYEISEDDDNSPSLFSFVIKSFMFLCCVFIFSCYIYGGQDFKKGFRMASEEMKSHIRILEEEEPAVKQAMLYVRKAYNEMEHFTDSYLKLEK